MVALDLAPLWAVSWMTGWCERDTPDLGPARMRRPRRPYSVLFEINEELIFKKQCTRERALQIARAFIPYGFSGYGCGTPDMLNR